MLVFVSSIGRSGTRYLSEVVSTSFDVASFHLAEPYCHAKIYERFNRGEEPVEYDYKVVQVLGDADRIGGNYFESTPVFVRGFAEAILKTGREVGVIQLLRNPLEVAKSYTNRDSYPSHPLRPWRLPLGLPRSLIKLDCKLSPFQENLVDWLENEMRLDAIRSRFDHVEVLGFKDISNSGILIEILKNWGFPPAGKSESTSRDLDRNQNKTPTEIGSAELKEADELVKILKETETNLSIFRNSIYDGFEFVEQLRK